MIFSLLKIATSSAIGSSVGTLSGGKKGLEKGIKFGSKLGFIGGITLGVGLTSLAMASKKKVDKKFKSLEKKTT